MKHRPDTFDWEFAFGGTVATCEHRERPGGTHTVTVTRNGEVIERQTFTEHDPVKAHPRVKAIQDALRGLYCGRFVRALRNHRK